MKEEEEEEIEIIFKYIPNGDFDNFYTQTKIIFPLIN